MSETQKIDTTSFWQEQYDEASGGGNNFLFFKAERTRIRLIGVGDDPREYFRKTEAEYRGQKSPKYLVKGYEVTDIKNQTEFALQSIVFTKGTWAAVTNLLIEGYDLFSPEGLGLTVVRSNSGGRISYSVMASPTPLPVNQKMLEEASETPWQFYLDEFAKMQENRQNQSSSGDSTNSLADQIINSSSPNEW